MKYLLVGLLLVAIDVSTFPRPVRVSRSIERTRQVCHGGGCRHLPVISGESDQNVRGRWRGPGPPARMAGGRRPLAGEGTVDGLQGETSITGLIMHRSEGWLGDIIVGIMGAIGGGLVEGC